MNFQTIGIILSYVITFAILSVKWWFPKLFQHSLDKKLVKYKTELETEKEKQLSEYSKSITGFNKFFDKKYEVYPLLYSKLNKAQGEISSWWPSQPVNDISKLTMHELKGYLDTFNFSIPDKRLLIEKYEKQDLTQLDFLKLIPNHLRVLIQQANNYFQFNRLFLSKNVETLVNEIIISFNDAWSGYHGVFSYIENNPDDKEKIKQSYNSSSEKILALLIQMRSELEHNLNK